MNFHLTKTAQKDLINIAIYTEENWGIKQRDFYLEQFDVAFKIISKSPKQGQKCDEIIDGYYKFIVGKHLVFYRFFSAKEIQIVRILHGNMDISNSLKS